MRWYTYFKQYNMLVAIQNSNIMHTNHKYKMLFRYNHLILYCPLIYIILNLQTNMIWLKFDTLSNYNNMNHFETILMTIMLHISSLILF